MKKQYITLCDITIDELLKNHIKVIPRGTILTEWRDGIMFESKDPVMCIGVSWVENNPHIFKEI